MRKTKNLPQISIIIIGFNEEKRKIESHKIVLNKSTRDLVNGVINVGVIGLGGFANGTHLPNLKALSKYYKIVAVADKKPEVARMIGLKYDVDFVTTDYKDILENDNIDMVVITTRHNLHGEIVIEALKKGKHVLVEKPLTLEWDELNVIKNLVENGAAKLCVGFNRRYSPEVLKVKEILKSEDGYPCYLYYRVNAGHLPKSVWVNDPLVGGGRIIGEVCHFIDLLNYVMDSEIVDFQFVNIPVDSNKIQNNDNISVNIKYKNGGIAQMAYFSIGGKSLPKESIQIHANHKSYFIEDFNKLNFYGTKKESQKYKLQDKGHKRELEEFAKLIKNQESLISSNQLDYLATELTLNIMDVINGKNN